MNDVFIGEACDGGVLGITNIVVIGIKLFHIVLHIVALLLGIALSFISGTNTGYLLRDWEHIEHMGMEIAGCGVLLAEHIAKEISRHFLLLIIVMELDTELLLQRIDNVRHRLFRKVFLVGIHAEDACAHLCIIDGALAGDARHPALAYRSGGPIINNSDNLGIFECSPSRESSSVRFLHNLICHLAIPHLLHTLVLGIFQFQVTATTARVEPFVDIIKQVLDLRLVIGLLLEETLFYITYLLQPGLHSFVALRVQRLCVKRLDVVGALGGEET